MTDSPGIRDSLSSKGPQDKVLGIPTGATFRSFFPTHALVASVSVVVNWLIHVFVSFPDPNANGFNHWVSTIEFRDAPVWWSDGIGVLAFYSIFVLFGYAAFILLAMFSGENSPGTTILADCLFSVIVVGPLVFFAPIAAAVLACSQVILWKLALKRAGHRLRPSSTVTAALPMFSLTLGGATLVNLVLSARFGPAEPGVGFVFFAMLLLSSFQTLVLFIFTKRLRAAVGWLIFVAAAFGLLLGAFYPPTLAVTAVSTVILIVVVKRTTPITDATH